MWIGDFVRYLWWGGCDPDEVNPESGLSRRDIYQVRSSWTKLTANSIDSGSELFMRYFALHPEYQKYFDNFKDSPIDILRSNIQFHAHVLAVMTSLTTIIDNLDKPDLAVVICQKLGHTHSNMGISEQQFDEFKDIIVNLFVNDLKFNEATMGSWTRTIELMYKNIYKTLKPVEN